MATDAQAQQFRDGISVDALPEELHSPRAKLVYLYLRLVRRAEPAELQATLGMGALSLYPVLETLVDTGLVQHNGDTYTCPA